MFHAGQCFPRASSDSSHGMKRTISGYREGKSKMAKPEPVIVSALSRIPSPKKSSNKKTTQKLKDFKKNLSQAWCYTLLSPALGGDKILGAHWPASPAHLTSFRPVRGSTSNSCQQQTWITSEEEHPGLSSGLHTESDPQPHTASVLH